MLYQEILPNETWINILRFVPLDDIVAIKRVSKIMYMRARTLNVPDLDFKPGQIVNSDHFFFRVTESLHTYIRVVRLATTRQSSRKSGFRSRGKLLFPGPPLKTCLTLYKPSCNVCLFDRIWGPIDSYCNSSYESEGRISVTPWDNIPYYQPLLYPQRSIYKFEFV